MADRTSAEHFARFFNMLARNPSDEHKAMACELWNTTRGYDFHPCQMGCDESLIALGLAKRVPDDDHEYGDRTEYSERASPDE